MFKDTVLSNFLFALLLTNTLAVVPVQAQAQEPAKPELKVGFVPGPYNDPVNLQRALWVLRDLGLIEIRDSKPIDVTELDVIKNPGGIKIVPLEAAQAPRALDDVDFAAVQGNFAIYSGLKLTNAFALEKMTTPYINVVAVKRGNAENPWAQDIVAGYKSQTFKTAILSDRFYEGFALPDYMK
jgi:D-methionine transport system substrate-binding protein